MKSIALLSVSFSLLLFSDLRAQDNITFKDSFTIGLENGDPNYLFTNITSISTIGSDTLLLVDASDNAIRLYGKNGVFIKKIGRRGRGPGDFREVTSILVKDRKIIALDRFLERITVFDFDGKLVDTYSLEASTGLTAQFIYHDDTSNNYYVFFRGLDETVGYLIHEYDSEFQKTGSVYFDVYDTFFDKDVALERRLSISPRYLSTKFGDNQLAIVPTSYTGNIGVFDIKSKTTKTIGTKVKEFYQELDWNKRDQYRSSGDAGYASMSGSLGRFAMKLKGVSIGLVGNENYLLHFYGLFDKKIIVPYLAVYDVNGKLILNKKIDSHIKFTKGSYYRIRPKLLDNNNMLYTADFEYKSGYTVFRAIEVNMVFD